MKNRTWIIVVVSFAGMVTRAQDLHFSQYNENTALLNPALTGVNAPVRAGIYHKNQWASVTSPYRTYGASVESRFRPDNWEQVDKFRSMTFRQKTAGYLSGGFSVYTDRAGAGNLGSLMANVSLSSVIPLNKYSYVSAGIQAGIVQRSLSFSNLVFPNQYNGETYDQSMSANETRAGENVFYPDFAAGMSHIIKDEDRRSSINQYVKGRTGVAVFHVARPEFSFLGTATKVYRRVVLHGDYEFGIPYHSLAIAPSFMVQMSGPSSEITVGSQIRYCTNNASKYTGLVRRNYLSYGMYYRHMDAMVILGSLEWKEQYSVTVSYDVNISSLVSASSARGGFEITLRYTKPPAYLFQKKE